MRQTKLTSTQQTILITFILVVGSIMIFMVSRMIRSNENTERESQLQNVHKRALTEFSKSIDHFATLVAGMQGYLKYSETFPNEDQLKQFVYHQLSDVHFNDSIVISYLDTTGIFQYVFTGTQNDPAGLQGKSIYDFRENPLRRDRISDVYNEELLLSKPLNLAEGWVGIPMNFNVVRNGELLGYISTVIDFRALVDGIYDSTTSGKFAFRFITDDGIEFDRAVVYDGDKVYNQNKDPQFYKNFNLPEDSFVFSEIEMYGKKFKIGTAYKEDVGYAGLWSFFIFGWYILLLTFLALIFFQGYRYRLLNKSLKESNKIITAQKERASQQFEELKKLNITKNRFFHIIAHDLKNPFSAIHSIISLIKEHNLSPDESTTMIGNLTEVTQRTQNLLENLLKWAQIQTDEIKYEKNMLILDQLIEDVVITMHPQADNKNIQIETSFEKGLVINADYEMFTTIIKNLISNGIKYCTPGEGLIKIRSFSLEEEIYIEVIDNGVGMSDEERAIIFNLDRGPSFQGTIGEKGTGLGLVLSKEFLKLHDGAIEVSSQKGVGSKFVVSVPKFELSKTSVTSQVVTQNA